MFHFYTPWNRQKTIGFLTFLGSIEIERWYENAQYKRQFWNKTKQAQWVSSSLKRTSLQNMNSVPSTMNEAADTICMISCVFTIAVCTERGFFLIISSSTGSTPRLNISKIYLRINLFLANVSILQHLSFLLFSGGIFCYFQRYKMGPLAKNGFTKTTQNKIKKFLKQTQKHRQKQKTLPFVF